MDNIKDRIAEALYLEYMRGRYYTNEHTWVDYKAEFPDSAKSFIDKATHILSESDIPI